jgi:hypothetical protein
LNNQNNLFIDSDTRAKNPARRGKSWLVHTIPAKLRLSLIALQDYLIGSRMTPSATPKRLLIFPGRRSGLQIRTSVGLLRDKNITKVPFEYLSLAQHGSAEY